MASNRRPSIALALLFAAVVSVGTTAAPAQAYADDLDPVADADVQQWWTPNYLVDYGIIAAGTTGYIVGERLTPRADALIGPTYDPDAPTDIFVDDRVGRTYLEEGVGETFPELWLQMTMVGVGLSVAGLETARWATGDGSAQQLHDTVVGYAEATALTATATSMTKPFFGRLRPDFGERALRYHCTTEPDRYDEYCEDYRDRPLADDPDEAAHLLLDGRRSFFSGHASHSFNTFTYASLAVGGHFVWGDGATTASRIGGIAAQTAMMSTAAFVSGSRLIDGRHHPGDVIAGSLVGLGIANLAYWRRFDTSGAPRTADAGDDSTIRTAVQPFGAGPGIAVTVVY